MSVEIQENEVIIRFPKSKYNQKVQTLIEQLEACIKESDYFFDVEKESSLETFFLEVKEERKKYVQEQLNVFSRAKEC